MPIFDKDISIHQNVSIWKITESYIDLLDLFEQKNEINNIISLGKNVSYKEQFLASRLLLLKEFNDWKVVKNSYGKPFLEKQIKEISITHDRGIVALINSDLPCGIDIQEINSKVLRIKNKFVNKKDIYFDSKNEFELTTLWCAKEALYKVNGNPSIFFKDHIIIERTDKPNILTGKIIHPQYCEDYKMKVHFIENYCLVYTL